MKMVHLLLTTHHGLHQNTKANGHELQLAKSLNLLI